MGLSVLGVIPFPMAKDPAFLFYASDFLTGTMFMTNEQVGLYIRMLCAQHQHGGRIDTNVLRTQCESITGGIQVFNKFQHDETGSYNERLNHEMILRKEKSLKAAESVKKRWEKHKEQTQYDSNTNVLRSVNENENEIEDITEVKTEKKPRSKFVQPEYQEIESYMRERNSVAGGVWKEDKVVTEAKKYFNYYQSNGWRVGKNPMKDWQAAARNWMNNANQYNTNGNGRQQQQADSADHRARKEQILRGAFGQSNGFANEEPASQEHSAGS